MKKLVAFLLGRTSGRETARKSVLDLPRYARTFAGRCSLGIALVVIAMVAPASAAEVKSLDLGKNVQVWLAEDHTLPIVSLSVSFPAGSAYDPAGKAGLASFAASLIDEGAGGMNARAFHGALADRAIQFNVNVERDYMVVGITSLSENLPEALRLLQTALLHPRFDNDAVTRVRAQIVQGLEQGESQPPTVARRAFTRAFFGDHAYAHPVDGEISTITAITPEDLRGFARAHWVKGGLKIAIAGDISAVAASKLLGDTFKPVSGATPPPLPQVGRLGQPGVHVTAMAVPQPTILFGLPGIMRADPDFIPGYVANYIVGGGGFSSRLTDEVRVKRGLTYGVSTALTAMNRASVMQGSVATRANAVRQTIQVVKDTLARFAAEGPTQAELDDAKTYLTGSFPIAFASNAGTAAQLSTFQRQGLDAGYVARRNGLIQAVTLDDVKRVAKKLFDPARLTVVVAGSPQDGRPAPQVPRAPVRPAPAAPGTPSSPAAAKPAPKPGDVKPAPSANQKP
jgi:zinc protease